MKLPMEAVVYRTEVRTQLDALRKKEAELEESYREAVHAHNETCRLCASSSQQCAAALQLQVKYKRQRNNVMLQQVDRLRQLALLSEHLYCTDCCRYEKNLPDCHAMGCVYRQDSSWKLTEEIWRLLAIVHEDDKHNPWRNAAANFAVERQVKPFGVKSGPGCP